MLEQLWCAVTSPGGLAVAQWASLAASILAAIIAVVAIKADTRRAEAERARVRQERIEGLATYLGTTITILINCCDQIQRRDDALAQLRGDMLVTDDGSSALFRELAVRAEALRGLRMAAPIDPALVVTLSSASADIAEVVDQRGSLGMSMVDTHRQIFHRLQRLLKNHLRALNMLRLDEQSASLIVETASPGTTSAICE